MLAAAHGSGSGADLAGSLVLIASVGAFLVGIAAFILDYTTSVFRRRLIIGVPVSARLIGPSVVRPDLHVLYRDEELSDPHILEVALTYRGRRDIKADFFEQDEPFSIDVGVPIIDLLEKIFDPEDQPLPKVEAVGTALKIGPSLLHKGLAMTFVVLTDGPCAQLRPGNPLADVKVRLSAGYKERQDAGEAHRLARQGMLSKIVTWAVVIFIAFYLITQPQGAANVVHGLVDLLRDVGDSLTTFVNSF
jgi:hypothetical protein